MTNKIKNLFQNNFICQNLFIIIIISLSIILSLFKINGSSVGVYNKIFYGEEFKDENLILGVPRRIRTDEYIVATPYHLSQYFNDYEEINDFGGNSVEISAMNNGPAKAWPILFTPSYWPYILLPLEIGFAARWWFKAVILLTGSYIFFRKITRNPLLSAGASLTIFLVPFVQWWYSTGVVELIGYMFFILYFLIRILEFKDSKGLFINSSLLAFFCLCFVMVFYPPFQIPLVIGSVLFFIGYVLDHKDLIKKKRFKSYYGAFIFVALFISIIGLLYYAKYKDVLEVMMSTVYPGSRIVESGGFSITKYFNGFYNLPLLTGTLGLWMNQSESANFMILAPLSILFSLFLNIYNYMKNKKLDFLTLTVTLFLIMTVVWMFVSDVPQIFGKITLFQLVPHDRMLVGVGIFDFILCVLLIQKISIQNINSKLKYVIATILSFLVISAYFKLGLYIRDLDPAFLNSRKLILLLSVWLGLVVFSLLSRKKYIFIFSLLLFNCSSLLINPLYRGLDPILNSELINSMKEVTIDENAYWISYNEKIHANYFLANGFKTFNATQLYPSFEFWSQLDPDGKYEDVYNRYSHIGLDPIDDVNQISLYNQAPDNTVIQINPCNQRLGEMNVKYYIFSRDASEYTCLEQKAIVDYHNVVAFYLYERID